MAKKPKRPTAAVPVTGGKQPHAEPPGNALGRRVRFRFDQVDLDSQWCFSKISSGELRSLLDSLRQFETMTVQELFYSTSGSPVGRVEDMSVCPNGAVLDRLAKEYEGRDSMARLRLSNMRRLHGFLDGHEFSIVWWDPNHQVWPSTKR